MITHKQSQNFLIAEIHNQVSNSEIDKLIINWVPSHVGINVNEKADIAAKTALVHGKGLTVDLTPQEAIRKIGCTLWKETIQEVKNNCINWDRDLNDSITATARKPWFKTEKYRLRPYDIKLINRLMTGYTYNKSFLHLMHSHISNMCNSCNIIDTPNHAIFECSKYRQLRDDFHIFEKFNNIDEVLTTKNPQHFQELISFIYKAKLDKAL
ncbi:uncharacterized protein LOC118740438 [Rhagoletis pomonella]|uniref:uncharacterized protein LOC118740438 n=1 Tax=Rhagoletis pomonella TaxID=28610 RepID=UPI0017827972|nr:uncharacterized protein LOC118740438 [Rhagoletis pomonella]